MNSENLCPYCKSYERCRQYGWDSADRCVNFEKRDDIFDMKPLFEAAKDDDNTITVEMPTNRSEDIVNFSFFIPDDRKLAVGKIDTSNLMSNTLQIDKCERIVLRDKTLDFQFEIGHDQYKDIDTIIVNGIKFKREN